MLPRALTQNNNLAPHQNNIYEYVHVFGQPSRTSRDPGFEPRAGREDRTSRGGQFGSEGEIGNAGTVFR